MNFTGECDTDEDCRLSLHCYYDEKADSDICGCSGYYGWEGENCTDLGPTTVVYITSCSLQVFLCLIGLLLWVKDVAYIRQRKIKVQLKKPKTMSWLYSSTGLTIFLAWRLNEIISAASPEKNDYLFPDDSHFEKAHQYVLTSRILQSFVFICTVNGMLVVSVMWIEIAYRSEKMILGDEKNIKRFHLLVNTFQLLFALVIFICIISGRYSILGYVSFPLLFLISCTHTIGKIKFSGLIKNVFLTDKSGPGSSTFAHMSPDQRENYKKMIRQVGIASTVIVILLYGVIVAAVAYAIQDILLPNYYIGNFPFGMVIGELMLHCILVILLTLGWYTRQSYYFDSTSSKKHAVETNLGTTDLAPATEADGTKLDKSSTSMTDNL